MGAALSLVSCIPFAGWGARAAKAGRKISKAAKKKKAAKPKKNPPKKSSKAAKKAQQAADVVKGKVVAEWLEKCKNMINPLSKWITGMIHRAWKSIVNKAGQALSWIKKQPIIPIARREPKGALAFPGGGGWGYGF